MPSYGLRAWGAKRWFAVRACALLVTALFALSCGEGDGRKKAVECQTTDDCSASDLGVCDTVACEDNRCVQSSLRDGARCDDADPLTGNDACSKGVCAGTAKTCEDELGPCLKAAYDPETDSCSPQPVEDGAPCDDDNACTQSDSCNGGECTGAEPKTCEAADDCHDAGECDPATGECSSAAKQDGEPCDDSQACTTNDVCTEGACGGEAVVCDDGLACSGDRCDEASGACAADTSNCSCEKDADCQDGNACNGLEICDPTQKLCRLGTAVVCPTSADPCLQNSCTPETGACEPEPVKDGAACDDSNGCTEVDTCQAGQCEGSAPVVCMALSQCHLAGTCEPSTGQCSNPEKPNKSACNDGNACTLTDSCQAGSCLGSAPTVCAATDQCHDAGACNTATGVCSKPNKSNGVKCNDGNACSSGDACQNGVCSPTSQVTCTALSSCHSVGTCNASTGLCTNPLKANGTACDDGKLCTTADKCSAGVCAGTAQVCNDGISCTVDSCSEQLGGCTTSSAACACQTSADCNDGNPCNGIETCNLQTLQCQAGTAVSCTGLNDACNVGTCSAATGKCEATPKANGTTCDDANACTQASSCQAGVCQGQSPVVCAASDQCHSAGTCNPSTGACTNPSKANGAACNDGNACTKTDSCQSGVCSGSSAVVCAASDQCHSAGTCNPSTGACSEPAKPNGTACSDGTLCTQTDTCQGGTCVGASPVTCAASDQCHGAGSCDSATGKCSNPAKVDGTACEDGSLCTQKDSCQAGTCKAGAPVTCTASDQCHGAGTCDGASGKCSNPNKANGTACNDSSACTKTDTCQAGACVGASPVTCTASDQCHDAGTCNPSTGVCSSPNKADSTPCGDGKACTGGDVCKAGACVGAAVTCDDKIACTADSCAEPGGCFFDQSKCGCAKDADCNDGNACNGVEKCNLQTLSCVAGTAVSCASLDDACNVGTCDGKTGACSAVPRKDGTACDDGNACTKTDGCAAGKCAGTNAVTCTASDPCHSVGVCDTKTGACSSPSKPDGAACNDGNPCTQADSCQAGACVGASPVSCAPSDQCHTAGTCDSKTGQCSNPIKTGACDDGDKCTQTDTCQNGACVGGNPKVCTASDQCHEVGACVKATGVCSNPSKADGTLCDDGNQCTQSDACQTGSCAGTKPVVCQPLGACFSAGTCDVKTGICSNPPAGAGTSCTDGNACTTGETCDGKGACNGGGAVICTPASVCKTASCNASSGCQSGNQPNGTPCNDGSQCTQTDSCSNGACTGGDKLLNGRGDWADDPGSRAGGPTSVDLFTDKAGRAHVVGTYLATVAFNDKEDPKTATNLALPQTQTVGIYWAVYSEAGVVLNVANLGGLDLKGGTLTVADAAIAPDGTFTLLGTLRGNGMFGLDGKTQDVTASQPRVFVAKYSASGNLSWLALFAPSAEAGYTADSVSMYDDGAVVAIGTVTASITFSDVNGKPFASTQKPGVWAARLDADGVGAWGQTVVTGGSSLLATAVATHERGDDGASLTGGFAGEAALGPNGEIKVSTSVAERPRDIWYQKLDAKGAIRFGGRVGGPGAADVPGDVARIKGGGALLLANTSGPSPTASDAKSTQQLHAAPSGLQAHLLVIDPEGTMQGDALVTNKETGASQGYRLELDSSGYYAVAGRFAGSTSFWSKVGFGAGAPSTGADFAVKSALATPGASTLFVARVDAKSVFGWAVQAGGDGSGMATAPWDIVLAAHPSHSTTVAGLFNSTAIFGDQVTETLQAIGTSNAFVVHLNSEAEYDYCK
ncbi:MAG: hypothetical protein EOO73_01155 [Myxococcales bacterium]|nr:MAG: hypothetical protein EOO73_01155 [Myxococcales bacterium]